MADSISVPPPGPTRPTSPLSPIQEAPHLRTRLKQEVLFCRLSIEDLRSLCAQLQERANSAADIEWSHIKDRFKDNREQAEAELRDGFVLRVSISGQAGADISGLAEEVFSSPNLPSDISSLYVHSGMPLRTLYNYVPRNAFELFLDFHRPHVLDFTVLPSSPTPNGSTFLVDGLDASWANGVFYELQAFFDRHRAIRWLHKQMVYDCILWVVGLPLSFYVCYRLSPLLKTWDSDFLRAALYVYAFLLMLLIFRAFFHYARWVFPAVEFIHSRSRVTVHRAAIISIVGTLVGALLLYLIKAAL